MNSTSEDRYDRMAATRKARTPEQKAATKAKIQATWKAKKENGQMPKFRGSKEFFANMTPEERKAHSEKLSQAQKGINDRLTEEEKLQRAAARREASQRYWANLTQEERDRRVQQSRDRAKRDWAASDPDKTIRRAKAISEGRKKYWAEMDSTTKEQIASGHSKWWNSIDRDQYHQHCLLRAYEENSLDHDVVNELEQAFANQLILAKISYHSQVYNIMKHPEFDERFPENPYAVTKLTNPYHQWDFKVRTREGDAFIDIDGSIHNPRYNKSNVVKAKLFRDQMRPYQTDGLPAYAVCCYDGSITDQTTVIKIDTGEMIMLHQLMSILRFMNLTDKEKRKVVNE